MKILEVIFKLFQTSELYHSYSLQQQEAVKEICNIHLDQSNLNYKHEVKELLHQLEKKVSRRVLSSSISNDTIIYLLQNDLIDPSELEIVNLREDIEDEVKHKEFINLFVSKLDMDNDKHKFQINHFPDEYLDDLTDENRNKITTRKS